MTDYAADDFGRIAMTQSLAATLARAVEYAHAQMLLEVTLEHLLLALTEDPDAALVLAASNVDTNRLKADVSSHLSLLQGSTQGPPSSLAVAAELRRILEAATAAARGGRRREISGAIVLAAIVGDGKTPAAHMLHAQGLNFDAAIRALQGSHTAAPAHAAASPAADNEAILANARERVQSRFAPGSAGPPSEFTPAPNGHFEEGYGAPPLPDAAPAPAVEPPPDPAWGWAPPPVPPPPPQMPAPAWQPAPPQQVPQQPGDERYAMPRPPAAPYPGSPNDYAPPDRQTGGYGAPPPPPREPPRPRPARAQAPAPAVPAPAQRPRPSTERGLLVENIPRTMRVGIAALVTARIGKGDIRAIAEGLQGSGASYSHEVMVTRAMSVRLRSADGGFFIESASPETQWIDQSMLVSVDDFASWRWTVTPRTRGAKRLQLIIAARTVGVDGLAAETALPDQVVEVKVKMNAGRTAVRWAGWIAAAIAGGVLARVGEGVFDSGLTSVSRLFTG